MSTSAPKSPAPGPLAPPEEKFWEKYSPHYEFPLSSIGSIAMHIGALVVFLGLLYMLSRMTISDRTPVPMRAMSVVGDGDGPDSTGSGGGEENPEDVTPFDRPMDRHIPEATLDEVKTEVKDFLPKVPSLEDGLRPEDLPSVKKIAELNEDLRRKLLEGMNKNKGKGPGQGKSDSAVDGPGAGTQGDATSSSNRAVRWELIFKTESGRDYLNQLAAMKATLVIPNPPDWKTSKAYPDLSRPTGRAFNMDEMPGLYFVDDDGASAAKVAQAIGLEFAPPLFIAFFPKDIEEELAEKERAYRGRKESEIFSTKFRVLVRDGKPVITVTDQIPVRK